MQQQLLTAANLSSRAADLPVLGDVAERHAAGSGDVHTRARFARVGASSAQAARIAGTGAVHDECLYIVNSECQLTEYAVAVSPMAQHAKYKAETPLRLTLTPTRQWQMARTRNSVDVRPPFTNPTENRLVQAAVAVAAANAQQARERTSGDNGATRRGCDESHARYVCEISNAVAAVHAPLSLLMAAAVRGWRRSRCARTADRRGASGSDRSSPS